MTAVTKNNPKTDAVAMVQECFSFVFLIEEPLAT